MSFGYSQRTARSILDADPRGSLGVALGQFCVRKDIPISAVAETLGVSRMTVYNWALGRTSPSSEYAEKITKWMRNYRARLKKKQ